MSYPRSHNMSPPYMVPDGLPLENQPHGMVYSVFSCDRFWLCSLLLLPLLAAAPQSVPPATDDYSGMYTFLREGEFIQVTIEEEGKVSGFISRFGDSDTDKNEFLDQFFESGKLDSGHLTFTTKKFTEAGLRSMGRWVEVAAKKPEDEGILRDSRDTDSLPD